MPPEDEEQLWEQYGEPPFWDALESYREKDMTAKIYCDGATDKVCYIIEGCEPVVKRLPRKRTNNEAEYLALITALEAAKKARLKDIEIMSDSQLIVNQVNSRLNKTYVPRYKTREKRLYNLGSLAISYFGFFKNFALLWIPREENLAGHILEGK